MDILAESTIYGFNDRGLFLVIVGLLIFLLGFFTAIIDSLIPGLGDSLILGSVIMIVGVFITVGAVCIYTEPCKRLKVILSDDYPASELYENYTIVDQDGKIWILDEKH